jgi:hypothetical protein
MEKKPKEFSEIPSATPVPSAQIINQFTKKNNKLHSEGVLSVSRYELDDEISYDVLYGRSSSLRCDTLIVATSSWLTGLEGFNEDFTLQLMNTGFDVAFISTAIGKQTTLLKNAEDIHVILDDIDKKGRHHEKQAITVGASRGAMVGFGIESVSEKNQRKIIYSDIVDPCQALPLVLRNPKQIFEYLRSIPDATNDLFRVVAKLPLKKKVDYLRTIELHPQSVLQIIHSTPSLFSGEAGELAQKVSKDAHMHIRFFDKNPANDAETYIKYFADHSGVIIEKVPGAHLSLLSEDTTRKMLARLATLGSQLNYGATAEEINFKELSQIR